MAADRNNQRSREVSAMIKQGFIADQSLTSSPSGKVPMASPSSSPSRNSSPSNNPSPLPLPPATSPRQVPSNPSPILSQMMPALKQQRESTQLADRQREIPERIRVTLSEAPFQDPNWGGPRDVQLVVVSRDGSLRVPMHVHWRVLASRSEFFADKMKSGKRMMHSVEISDCDDVEMYVETVVLMYCDNLKKKLMGEDVERVLRLLKVSSDIKFNMGIMSCLEYLEAIPWTEVEEDKVVYVLGQLQPHDSVTEVLQRLSSGPSTSAGANDILLQVMDGVLQAKDDKARREMKSLVSRLLIEEPASDQDNKTDVSEEILNNLCQKSLSALITSSQSLASMDASRRNEGAFTSKIAREADNLLWVVDILIHKDMGDKFAKLWANQKELASLHPNIPQAHRYELSRVTAELCTAIARGLILVSRDTRYSLLYTWLEALYADFGWMRRYRINFDRKLVEEGLGQTILTLSLAQQQVIFLDWFNHFVNKGDDCPNLQRAFEVWWRRTFVTHNAAEQDSSNLQLTLSTT
ncbi:BTB/POZ [Macleaya cordata]|uniref:BTB/POZ n=1 Tax=Macleaya cordata TaxID=56857 RepID=A0A200R673_MACCD|nr:BTB/POZ [Macleaya cordata]